MFSLYAAAIAFARPRGWSIGFAFDTLTSYPRHPQPSQLQTNESAPRSRFPPFSLTASKSFFQRLHQLLTGPYRTCSAAKTLIATFVSEVLVRCKVGVWKWECGGSEVGVRVEGWGPNGRRYQGWREGRASRCTSARLVTVP